MDTVFQVLRPLLTRAFDVIGRVLSDDAAGAILVTTLSTAIGIALQLCLKHAKGAREGEDKRFRGYVATELKKTNADAENADDNAKPVDWNWVHPMSFEGLKQYVGCKYLDTVGGAIDWAAVGPKLSLTALVTILRLVAIPPSAVSRFTTAAFLGGFVLIEVFLVFCTVVIWMSNVSKSPEDKGRTSTGLGGLFVGASALMLALFPR